jgi:hypothetical protein
VWFTKRLLLCYAFLAVLKRHSSTATTGQCAASMTGMI